MKDEALRLALEGFENIKHHFDTDEYAYEVAVKSITAIKQALEQPEPEPVAEGEQHMIYMTFKQWVNGRFLETGEPRKKAYSKAERDLVEMGWNYGYDAGVQWQKSQQALDKKAENARELGLDYKTEDEERGQHMTFAEWWDTLTEAEHRLLGKTNAAFVWLCATQAEREACAKVCEAWVKDHAKTADCTYADCDFVAAATDCAEAIRARGNNDKPI